MALDPIWQQQLSLVSYGNLYLQQAKPIEPWLEHAIFYGQQFEFRDLNSHALLASHFQLWLQGLKAQGVQRLSLHAPQLLIKDKNPNPNVVLIDAAPVMVSHSAKGKQVWIYGAELAAWDEEIFSKMPADQPFEPSFKTPITQRSHIQHYQFWRFTLSKKHDKAILNDLKTVNWDVMHQQLLQQFISPALDQGFMGQTELDSPFYGSTLIEAHPDVKVMDHIQLLPILPSETPAALAHAWLHRATAFCDWLQEHPQALPASFTQKWQQAMTQLIVDIANHYPTAHLTPATTDTNAKTPTQTHKGGATVWTILLIVMILCAAAYYFNL